MDSYAGVVCHGGLVFAYNLRQSVGMSTNAQRFGRLVKARREELDLNQLEVHAAGGPSNSTMTKIENGLMESLKRPTARKLDKGLQWAPGSARRLWEGGEAAPADHHGLTGRELDTMAEVIGSADLDSAIRAKLLAVLDAEREARGA